MKVYGLTPKLYCALLSTYHNHFNRFGCLIDYKPNPGDIAYLKIKGLIGPNNHVTQDGLHVLNSISSFMFKIEGSSAACDEKTKNGLTYADEEECVPVKNGRHKLSDVWREINDLQTQLNGSANYLTDRYDNLSSELDDIKHQLKSLKEECRLIGVSETQETQFLRGPTDGFKSKKSEKATVANPWVLWEGGRCPVSFGTMVDVRHRDGNEWRGVGALVEGSFAYRWTHQEHPFDSYDIVAWRFAE